jgi:fatty acid/phospholipid biosynthesis enzyme
VSSTLSYHHPTYLLVATHTVNAIAGVIRAALVEAGGCVPKREDVLMYDIPDTAVSCNGSALSSMTLIGSSMATRLSQLSDSSRC